MGQSSENLDLRTHRRHAILQGWVGTPPRVSKCLMVLASDRREGGPTGLDTNRVMGGHYYWLASKGETLESCSRSYEGFSLLED